MEKNYNHKILNEEKQQINEIFPAWLLWTAVAGLAAGGGAVGYNALVKSHEDQEMVETDKGFFEPKMYIGTKFKITYFEGDEEPWELMNLNLLESKSGWKSYSDEFGVYLKLDNTSKYENSDLRLYLPKKEWFQQFKGKIRTITDSAGVGSEKSNTYGLCFYLKNPQKALKTKVLKSDGSSYFGPPQGYYDVEKKQYTDDPSRGWEVLSVYKMSGYFSTEGNVYSDLIENKKTDDNLNIINEVFDNFGAPKSSYEVQKDYERGQAAAYAKIKQDNLDKLNNKLQNLIASPPSGLQEYEWATYGEKYGRSEFDRWYDDTSGTMIVIGMQICAGIVAEPLALGWAELAASGAGYAVRKYAIFVGAELIAGAWEASYLYNRGLTSQAALVLFCCFLPILTEGTVFGKLIGRPPGFDEAINDLVYNVQQRTMSGSFISPADFKKWLNGLEPGLRENIKNSMTLCAQHYSKYGTKEIQRKVIKAMSESLNTIKKSGIKGQINLTQNWDDLLLNWKSASKKYSSLRYIVGKNQLQRLYTEVALNVGGQIQKGKYLFLKSLGLNLFVIGGVLMPTCVLAIGDNEEMVKDPQGILDGSERAVAYLRSLDKKEAEKLQKKITELAMQISKLTNNNDMDAAVEKSKEYIKILTDLNFINDTPQWGQQKREYNSLIQAYLKNVIQNLKNEWAVAVNTANREKVEETEEKITSVDNTTETICAKTLVTNVPSNYKKVQDGYINEKGVKITLDNIELVKFFEWFCGYNVLSETLTNANSYQFQKNIIISPQFYLTANDTKVFQTMTYNNTKFIATLKSLFGTSNFTKDYYEMYDMTSYKYWGNLYYVRYVFGEYYDDYYNAKKVITTNK